LSSWQRRSKTACEYQNIATLPYAPVKLVAPPEYINAQDLGVLFALKMTGPNTNKKYAALLKNRQKSAMKITLEKANRLGIRVFRHKKQWTCLICTIRSPGH